MRKSITLLTALLVAQIVLTVALNLDRDGMGMAEFDPGARLLDLNPDSVKAIEITAGTGERLLIENVEETWRLPELDGFPASGESVRELLETLSSLTRGWPVATTEGAAGRFKTTEDGFVRKLVLSNEDRSLATLYLGSSPSFRKTHARLPGDTVVYGVNLGLYQLSPQAESWIERTVLLREPQDIQQVIFDDLALVRGKDGFEVADSAPGAALDQDTAQSLVNNMASLTIRRVAAGADMSKAGGPTLGYTVVLDDGSREEYAFYSEQNSTSYLLEASPLDAPVEVDGKVVTAIVNDKASLLPTSRHTNSTAAK